MFFSPLQIQVRVNWAPPSKCWSGFGWRSVIFCSLSGYIFGYLQVGWNAVFKASRHEELGLGLSRENTVRRQSANVLRGCNLCQSRMLGLENILVKQPCIHFFFVVLWPNNTHHHSFPPASPVTVAVKSRSSRWSCLPYLFCSFCSEENARQFNLDFHLSC